LRGAINVWVSAEGTEKLSHNVPVIERPDRINSLLYNLARGHALISGRRQLTTDNLWPVLDVAFDSAPATRAKLFRHLVEANGTLATTDVTKLLRCSPPTARKEMEALSVLGIVSKGTEDDEEVGRPATEITLAKEFGWFCGQECKQYRAQTPDTQGANLFKNDQMGIKKESSPCVTANQDEAVLAPAVL
jgi:hypothetical protein